MAAPLSTDTICEIPDLTAVLAGVGSAFSSLGRALLCANADFMVLHASVFLDELSGEPTREGVVGQPLEAILGADLFGRGAALRQALERGERREGWRATLHVVGAGERAVSISAAPFQPEPGAHCDPRVAFIVVLRGAEDEPLAARGPTLFAGLVSRSPRMIEIFRLIENLEHSDATVLLTGESGTGKEMIARAIHAHSPRRGGQFVAVNCGGLPGELLESELFGHVRGAFTGAVRDRIGRFEMAAGGTLFLDEIGDLPLPLQVKLLRVLQERTFERVGESRSRTSDARVIAATHLDLKRAALAGQFRDDLYFRLRVVPIELPPLRERREDIEPLAHALLAKVSARQGRAVRLAPEVMRSFLRYSWPGNVRELENSLEYALAVARGQTVHLEDLPAELLDPPAPEIARENKPRGVRSLSGASPDDDVGRLRAALERHRWRRDDAARELGMSRTTLWRRMRELGL
jgi:transcriptional regulator with PAS, ATPase and Fis domain